jgi:hypothetical protein
MARVILALAFAGAVLAGTPAAAQNESSATAPMAPPAPNDSTTGSIESAAPKIVPVPESREAQQPAENPPQLGTAPAKDKPPVESKAPENTPAENGTQSGAAAESKPADNTEGRYTFTRMNDGYVRLDNRTGQVSVCSKRTVGWTCQLAAEDRGALEGEITRLQDENVALKKELLANGMPLPGSMKGEPPATHHERSFSLPSTNDPNIERMKVMVEKAWRRLVDMISTLQKEVLKKTS